MTAENPRIADHPVNRIFLDRWSPRAFTAEAIPLETLFTIFEAARWAPSSFNSQPWRFIYTTRDSAHWGKFLGLLKESNKSWAKAGSALVFIISETTMVIPGMEGRAPSRSHSFDAGAAWASLALQAAMLGWYAHGMVGVDFERAKIALNVPDDYKIEAGVAIGRRGPKSSLPDALQMREIPNARKHLTEIVFEGIF
jgi:nitroreductase